MPLSAGVSKLRFLVWSGDTIPVIGGDSPVCLERVLGVIGSRRSSPRGGDGLSYYVRRSLCICGKVGRREGRGGIH